MTATEVLEQLRALGATLSSPDGFRLRVVFSDGLNPSVKDAVAEHKPALLEVLRRADAMGARIPPQGALPVLSVKDVGDVPGCCRSCGEPASGFRCELCTAAAGIAAERYMAGRREG